MAANLTFLAKELNLWFVLIVVTLICVFHATNQVNIINIQTNFIDWQLQMHLALQEALTYVVTVLDMFSMPSNLSFMKVWNVINLYCIVYAMWKVCT